MSTAATSENRSLRGDRGTLLMHAIQLDAFVSGAAGLASAAGAPLLDGLLGLSTAFLVVVGLFLIGYAAALVLLARMDAPTPAVKAVIAGNALWVLASVIAVLADWLALTTAGMVVVFGQAAAVALLAEAELIGLRRRGQSISL